METQQTRRGPGRPKGYSPQRSTQRLPQRAAGWAARRPEAEREGISKFAIPAEIIPDGMEYEYKVLTVLGETMRDQQVSYERDGAWRPVPANRHPELLGKFLDKDNPEQAIINGGQILMERPRVYSDDAREEEKIKADSRLNNQFESLGLKDKEGPPRMRPMVKRDYSVQAVPDDDEPAAP